MCHAHTRCGVALMQPWQCYLGMENNPLIYHSRNGKQSRASLKSQELVGPLQDSMASSKEETQPRIPFFNKVVFNCNSYLVICLCSI